MNNKNLEDKIALKAELVFAAQEFPYTFVQLKYEEDGLSFVSKGFSKCNPSDTWDEYKGMEIAVVRAVRKLRKQIQDFSLPLSA